MLDITTNYFSKANFNISLVFLSLKISFSFIGTNNILIYILLCFTQTMKCQF